MSHCPSMLAKFLCAGILLCFFLSCETIDDPVNVDFSSVDCGQLKTALVRFDNDLAATEIDKLTVDLLPLSSDQDSLGHEHNLVRLVNRIETLCNDLDAELDCYACMESLPPQSAIGIKADSSGTPVCRILFIFTPRDGVLKFHRVHYVNGC